jgi:hypothetical protein
VSGSFEAVPVPPDGYVPGEFVAYRQPDAVRAAALANAVNLVVAVHSHGGTISGSELADYTIDLAERFTAYLIGEEADG